MKTGNDEGGDVVTARQRARFLVRYFPSLLRILWLSTLDSLGSFIGAFEDSILRLRCAIDGHEPTTVLDTWPVRLGEAPREVTYCERCGASMGDIDAPPV